MPAQHWSARGVFDRFETLWGGFVVQKGGSSVYFAGDTGYGSPMNVKRTVECYAMAGAAGVMIEDQTWPKRKRAPFVFVYGYDIH